MKTSGKAGGDDIGNDYDNLQGIFGHRSTAALFIIIRHIFVISSKRALNVYNTECGRH
jgi:hypothetical protein